MGLVEKCLGNKERRYHIFLTCINPELQIKHNVCIYQVGWESLHFAYRKIVATRSPCLLKVLSFLPTYCCLSISLRYNMYAGNLSLVKFCTSPLITLLARLAYKFSSEARHVHSLLSFNCSDNTIQVIDYILAAKQTNRPNPAKYPLDSTVEMIAA